MAKRFRNQLKASAGRKPSLESAFTTDYVLTGWPVVLFQAALIAIVGLWIYFPALDGGWLWDDAIYISNNPLMHDPDRLWKAWFVPGSFMEYYPIEQTVEWWQWLLWNNDTFGYHLTNVILHIIGSLLVWRLLAKLGLSLAWVGGLLFVCHPVNVESVAWVVELKNCLSLPPFLLAMCCWIDFENSRRDRDYAWALGLFFGALLCKISVFLFPVVILLYAWWKRGRIGLADLLSSAPFFAVALIMVEIARHAGSVYANSIQAGIIDTLPVDGFGTAMALAGLASAFYFSHILLPVTLLPIYPVWDVNPPSALQFLPWLVGAGILAVLYWKRQTWGRHVLLGLGFFLIFLLPVLAFGYVFAPRDSWVMDHFLYIPVIGIIGLVTAALGQIEASLPRDRRIYLIAGITLVVVLLSFQAHGYTGAFSGREALWNYTLDRNPGAWTAQIDLGNLRQQENRLDEAASHFEEALRLKPDSTKALSDLGVTLCELGRIPEGVAQFRKAVALNPHDAVTLNNLGVVLAQTNQVDEARQRFQQATQVQPHFAAAFFNLGSSFFKSGQADEAMKYYRHALELDPDYTEAHFNLGVALNQQNRVDDAIAQFQEAVRLKPGYVNAHLNLGLMLEKSGRPSDAIEQFSEVLQLDPNNQVAGSHLTRIQKAVPASK